jgi:hypothetical protein
MPLEGENTGVATVTSSAANNARAASRSIAINAGKTNFVALGIGFLIFVE